MTGSSQIELQNGVVITNETINLGAGGTDFFGGLKAAANATSTWAGTVILDANGRLGGLNGSILEISGSIQNGTASNLIISATGTGSTLGTIKISGTGNTYTGSTTVFRGRLQLGSNNALPTGTTLDLDSTSAVEDSIFDLNGYNQTLGSLTRSGLGSGTGGSFIKNDGAVASTLTVNQTSNGTYSGIIQDGNSAVNFVKLGTGTQTLSGNNSSSGTTTVTAGTLILTGDNTISGEVVVNGGVLQVGHNNALGSTVAGTSVTSGRVVLQNGIVVTGETISIAGDGGNSNGPLQTAVGASAEWAGNVIVANAGARIGGGEQGTFTVSGVISGAAGGSILFNRGNDSTTILNAINTYTGATQLFANAGTVGTRLVIGVDNAINAASRLTVLGGVAVASRAMLLDFNGHVLTLAGLDSSLSHTNGTFLDVTNDGSSASTLTLSSTTSYTYSGIVSNGDGVMNLIKEGSGTQTLIGSNTYTGETTIKAGTLQIGGSAGTLGGNGALTGSGQINLLGGTLALDNLGTSNNNPDRLANSTVISLQGGSFVYRGSDQAATNSVETLGNVSLRQGVSTLSTTFGGTNTATVTAAALQRSANGGIALVNGVNLGQNGSNTTSISRFILTTGPTQIGGTAALNIGINSAAKNTQIIPFLLGSVTSSTNGTGTAGTANTFVTYQADTGLRPLNLTDEFTQNVFTTGQNTRLTTNTTLSATTAINSLILEGANATLNSGQTLTVTSGAILISGTGTRSIGGAGTLAFGTQEGIITSYASGGNTNLNSLITGSAGLSLFGTSLFVINQQNTFTGNMAIHAPTVAAASSAGSANAPTSGPFGRGTLILAGGSLRGSSGANIVLHNAVTFQADTIIPTGSTDKTLTLAGNVTLTGGTRTLTQQNLTAKTIISGNVGDAGNSHGLIFAGPGTVELSGANTYTGPTTITGGTLLINGNQSTATGAVAVGAGILGGTGTIGGATTISNGGTLNPGDSTSPNEIGKLNLAQGLTLKIGSVTNLQVTGATFTSIDSFGGNTPGTSGYTAYILANAGGQGNHDQLNITGSFNQETGAQIKVLSLSLVPAPGQIFNLADWTSLSGNSASGNLGDTYRNGSADNTTDLDLPDISASGYTWDTSLFASHGILVITPEPGRVVLMLIGFAIVGLRRRR